MEEGEQVGGYNTGNQEYRGGRGGKGFAEDAPHLPHHAFDNHYFQLKLGICNLSEGVPSEVEICFSHHRHLQGEGKLGEF